MLHTLITLQLADTDGRVFRLTPRVLGLAGDYLGSNKISTVVQPVCDRIAQATGRSTWAAVLDGHDMVTVAHALPRYPMDLSAGVGVRHPAFCTAAGRAVLGTLDEGARSVAVGRSQAVHPVHADQPKAILTPSSMPATTAMARPTVT